MRILYLSLSYVPSRRASSVHVMKMCAALARRGHEVTLVTKLCPPRQEGGVIDDFEHYGVEPSFEIVKLPRPLRRGGGLRFGWELWRLLDRRGRRSDLVYGRDLLGAALAVRRGLPTIFEAHQPPAGPFARRLFAWLSRSSDLRRLVVISRTLADHYVGSGLLPAGCPVTVAPDAADPAPGRHGPLPDRRLSDPAWRHLGYAGQLHPGKGLELLLRLAPRLPDCRFHVLGGEEGTLASLRAGGVPENLILHGFLPPAKLPYYYQAFELLLMPYRRRVLGASGRGDLSRWMSPMKMFEYMAAGRAIVASDLPVLREVLEPEVNAFLAPPDDLDAWEAAVRRLLADDELRCRLGKRAREDLLAHYTWDARAAKVLDGL